MSSPNDDVDQIKHRLNIADLVQSYVPMRKAGSTWKGLCPFHQEKSPSFTVNEERQIYKCFGCGEAGDIIDFVMKMEHLTFPEGLQLLADRAGVILDKRKTPIQYAQEKDEKSRLYQINRLAADVFHKILLEHPKAAAAREYLASRGLTSETIKTFHLGFAPAGNRMEPSVLQRFLAQRGFNSTETKKAGSPERFTNRLMFPLWDALGNPIGFTGRALDPNDQPKYLNTPETPLFKKSRILYPLAHAKDAIKLTGRVVMVEGQMDVLLAHQLGTKGVVATSGTALTTEHLEIVRRYTTKVLFSFDADGAGIEATRKAVLLAYDLELEPSVVRLPKGYKDLGELALVDPKAWQTALDTALPAFTWQLAIAEETTPEPQSATSKKAIGRLLLPLLSRMRDPIERAHWTQLLARKLGLAERVIIEALEKYNKLVADKAAVSSRTAPATPTRAPIQSARLTAEETLLGLLLLHPEELPTVATKIEPDDFGEGTRVQRLAKSIASWYTRTGSTNQADLLVAVKGELSRPDAIWLDSLMSAMEQLHAESDKLLITNEIRAGFDRLRTHRSEAIKERMAAAIGQAEASGDRAQVQKLLKELQEAFK